MDSFTLFRHRALERGRRVEWSAVWTWALSFGLVVYLGLKGGGYDPLVHDQVGIAVWWVLLAATFAGALPRRRLSPLAWLALGLLAAFVGWTALSLSWTESVERTSADLARVAGYLGVFALALLSRGSRGARRTVAAVGAGIAVVAIVGLLSRLHPSWFPEGEQTARFLPSTRERLAYPLNYWNALAALVAIGLPLILQQATEARAVVLRSVAAAAIPAMALTAFLTLSRGGIAAAAIALAVYLVLAPDRLPKLLTVAVSGAGAAILIAAADQRDALREGLLTSTARAQGSEMLAIVAVVCIGVALGEAALSLWIGEKRRPAWTVPSRRTSATVASGAAAALAIMLIVAGAPGRVSNAWSDFKGDGSPGQGTARLNSVSGEGRYQYWRSAVEESRTRPLTGTGSGTFEFWWDRNGNRPGTIRDTHSLYMQTLGELGLVGLALLAGFLLSVVIGGGRATVRAVRSRRGQLAAAAAGCVAFCVTASFDWMWQIPVLPVATLLLAAVLVSAGPGAGRRRVSLAWPLRVPLAGVALVAIVAIAIPLASATALRQSEADARSGDLPAALGAARTAQRIQPGAASPRLQQALVLEEQGDLRAASLAARAATEREPTNWRTWMVRSRIEAERGLAGPAVRCYRKARSLNPRYSLFRR
ncbi:MAG TPA: O-antigen ligase family protein [Solirubrobacterales bacterium]|nr:O-antigen ligase family protein [Solirubrobacterales bacterium]